MTRRQGFLLMTLKGWLAEFNWQRIYDAAHDTGDMYRGAGTWCPVFDAD